MTSSNLSSRAGGSKHPPVPSVRAEVFWSCVEAHPLVRVFRRYQRDCIARFRARFPDVTASMTDADVWEFTKARQQ